jgi:ectoine hydroxylase-related dioxygenase (phytanoyl-CoA dioxygenase family)
MNVYAYHHPRILAPTDFVDKSAFLRTDVDMESTSSLISNPCSWHSSNRNSTVAKPRVSCSSSLLGLFALIQQKHVQPSATHQI